MSDLTSIELLQKRMKKIKYLDSLIKGFEYEISKIDKRRYLNLQALRIGAQLQEQNINKSETFERHNIEKQLKEINNFLKYNIDT